MHKDIHTPKYIIQLARDLRNNMTPAEMILWNFLKDKKVSGVKFRKQHPIHRFILDFYCHEKRLAIEIDGNVHRDRKEYDRYRDAFLSSIGIRTLRFQNDEILNNIETIISAIKYELGKD